jgi:type II secretory pathway pseudopilin PulG
MTLVELLVVLSIILMVAAATIPRLRPEMDRSRVREAARAIQTYLSTARNLAMATGRSCGVMLERLPTENGCAMTLTQVETPVRYGGDLIGAYATVAPNARLSSSSRAYCNISLHPSPNQPATAPSVPLYPGDQIEIGYQGFWITLDLPPNNPVNSSGAITNTANLVGFVDTSHGEIPPWTAQQISGPYEITRWPTKSLASPLQLPSPACIDLLWSGIDPVATTDTAAWPYPVTPSTATPPVAIMFSPNGSVDKVYVSGSTNGKVNGNYSPVHVTSTVYLLVGRRDQVVDPPNPASTVTTNLNDFTNLWVAINGNTGLIVVSEECDRSGQQHGVLRQFNSLAEPPLCPPGEREWREVG